MIPALRYLDQEVVSKQGADFVLTSTLYEKFKRNMREQRDLVCAVQTRGGYENLPSVVAGG